MDVWTLVWKAAQHNFIFGSFVSSEQKKNGKYVFLNDDNK